MFPGAVWWLGVVTNNRDPDKAGKVQVRIIGVHDKLQESDLPWMPVLMPLIYGGTSEATVPPPALQRNCNVLGLALDGTMLQQNLVYGICTNAAVVDEMARNVTGAVWQGAAGGSVPSYGGGTPYTGTVRASGGISRDQIPPEWDAIVERAAAQYGVDPNVLRGLIMTESRWKPNAVSEAGAEGLAQLMPGTARAMGVTNPFDPEQSIMGGAKYLSQMLALPYVNGDYTLALSAYNQGPGKLQKRGSDPAGWPAETRRHGQLTLANAEAYRQAYAGG
jgi:hypothetical protein